MARAFSRITLKAPADAYADAEAILAAGRADFTIPGV